MILFDQSIHILGVTLESSLTMNKHATNTAAICNNKIIMRVIYIAIKNVKQTHRRM